MCSTNEPKVRRFTGATTKPGSMVSDALSTNPPQTDGYRWTVNGSALEAGTGDALDDVALEQQEHRDEREGAEDGGGHRVGVADAELSLDRRQADRNRHQLRVGEHEQRPEQVVPGLHEGEDRGGGAARPGQRHDDRPVDPPVPGTVDPRGLVQVSRQAV